MLGIYFKYSSAFSAFHLCVLPTNTSCYSYSNYLVLITLNSLQLVIMLQLLYKWPYKQNMDTFIELRPSYHLQAIIMQWYTVYCKSFKVETFRSFRTKLQFAGKHSQLDGSLAWPRPIAQAISLEKLRSYQMIHENHKTFLPQMICNIR